MEKRGRLINATLKSTGEVVTVRKEPEGTLFQDYYSDYDRKCYYTEDELDFSVKYEPLVLKLTEKQTAMYYKFCDEHSHPDFKIGSVKTLKFTSTGLGWSVSVTCPFCGETQNLTDYETW